jgi:hypothetical protein
MGDHYQDRTAVMARTVLAALAQYIGKDAVLRDYITTLLRDEIYDIERQIAADRGGGDDA